MQNVSPADYDRVVLRYSCFDQLDYVDLLAHQFSDDPLK
jgi:hypothetical protein